MLNADFIRHSLSIKPLHIFFKYFNGIYVIPNNLVLLTHKLLQDKRTYFLYKSDVIESLWQGIIHITLEVPFFTNLHNVTIFYLFYEESAVY
jgi:hypothetical protein